MWAAQGLARSRRALRGWQRLACRVTMHTDIYNSIGIGIASCILWVDTYAWTTTKLVTVFGPAGNRGDGLATRLGGLADGVALGACQAVNCKGLPASVTTGTCVKTPLH